VSPTLAAVPPGAPIPVLPAPLAAAGAGPTVPAILGAWSFDPTVVLLLVMAATLYGYGVLRFERDHPGARWPRTRTAAFAGGLVAVEVALQSPIDGYAGLFFWVHMVQHLILTMVAPPLLLLGAPMTLALRSTRGPGRRRIAGLAAGRWARIAGHPLVGWSAFVAVLFATHFSPLYQASLEHGWVHQLEHALYLGSGLLFWFPVVGLDPARRRLAHPLRLVYLFLAGPVGTVTALAIYSAGHVLYPHYARVSPPWGPGPLADQRLAGVVMWIGGDLLLVAALAAVLGAWMRHDRALGQRLDRRLDAGRSGSPGAV
jgi:putative membrane protein